MVVKVDMAKFVMVVVKRSTISFLHFSSLKIDYISALFGFILVYLFTFCHLYSLFSATFMYVSSFYYAMVSNYRKHLFRFVCFYFFPTLFYIASMAQKLRQAFLL